MRTLPLAAALLLLAASGIVHGLWTGRWGHTADLAAATSRCQDVAMTLGDWEGHAVEIDGRQLDTAEVLGYVARRYVHRLTGQQVTLLLVCGRPGPISLHPPDVCYAGAGYVVVGGQERVRVEGSAGAAPAELLTARFSKQQGAAPDPLRIFWGWSDRGPWQAPDNPRLSFARSPALYKLYVIRRLASPGEPLRGEPCLDFLQALMPELQRCLSAAS